MPSKCTVTGNLQQLSGGAIAAGQLTFDLINITPGQMPQVSGTSILPQLRTVVTTALDGSFTVAIWGNDNIVPPVTNYNVTFSDGQGNYLGPVAFTISGGSVNLNSATPSGANVITGAYTWSALQTFSAGISSDGTHAELIPATNSTLMDLASVQTVTGAKTFNSGDLIATAPQFNGTPTGTAIPTVTLKKGSGVGNYSSSSVSYVDVDGTNLVYTVTIPTGWKLTINAAGSITTNTGLATATVSLLDGSTIMEVVRNVDTATNVTPFALNWVITGDGASHTIKLQYKTSNGSDAVLISNSTATIVPTMVFQLVPSN